MIAVLPFESLAGVTGTGAGSSRDLESVAATHTLHVVETGGGTFSDMTVRLQGSHDGQNWFTLQTLSITNAARSGTRTVGEHLVRFVRASIDDPVTGSFQVTATIASEG